MRKLGDPVWGFGPSPCRVMFIGEAPGENEDQQGLSFVGRSGDVLWQMAWRYAQLNRDEVYTTNLVKVRPPNNSDPTPEMIQEWGPLLTAEIAGVDPGLIVTLGKFSTRYCTMLDEPMDVLNATIQPYMGTGLYRAVLPVVHPAAGLYDSNFLVHTMEGMKAVGLWLEGKGDRIYPVLPKVEEPRVLIPDRPIWASYFAPGIPLALDTEGTVDNPYSVQLANSLERAYICLASNKPGLESLWQFLSDWADQGDPSIPVLMHNAPWDIRVLRAMGCPREILDRLPIRDTMLAPYHLQNLPLGLKPLARKVLGMPMETYEEVTEEGLQSAYRGWAIDAAYIVGAATQGHDKVEPQFGKKGQRLKRDKVTRCGCGLCKDAKKLERAVRQTADPEAPEVAEA